MNCTPCYRRILTPPRRISGPLGCARISRFAALLAAISCGLACLCLMACIKSATQYIDRGNQFYAAGRYADATLNYRNAIKKRPDSGEAYYRLGLALLKQNQLGDAYQAFNHAVSLAPKNIAAKIQLGVLSLAIYTRDPKHPIILYNQALSVADQLMAPGGDRAEGLRLKGALALIDNHPGAAVEDLREAVRLAPANAEAAGELAQALLRDNQPDEAEKAARQAVQSHPKYNQAYEILYVMYASQRNWDKAEAALKLWGANNPEESGPVLRLAAFYYARKQPEVAEKTLDTLLNQRTRFPQADLLVGDFHAMIHNPERALADYQRGESRDRSRQQVYQQRVASALATLGRRDEAIKAADAILKKDPKDQVARALKAQVLDQMGGAQNLNTAATLANDLATEAPANARFQMLAGQAFLMTGNLNAASEHLERAAQADSRSPVPQLALARLELLRKNYAGVLKHADAALAIRQNDTNARLFRVIGLTGTHSYGAAKTEAEQLARDTKDAPQVEMQLGAIALGQGHYAEAEELFRKLYKAGSPDLKPLAALVDTYEAENMPDKALALMRAETERSPDSKGKEALLVATAEAAGKSDVALSELQKMAVKNPSSPDVQIRIGELQRKNGHLSEALQAFERARQLGPDRKDVDGLIGNLQEQMGQKTEAIVSYRKAVAKSPEDPVVLNNLAFLLADTGGDTNQALQMVTTAMHKAPDLPELRDTLAWVQIKRHNPAEAVPILQALTTIYPDNSTFRYHYAVALIDNGDRLSAKEQVETALSKKPQAELAGELRTLLAQLK
jgi:tetratricopeptide (TPR) repeat protein